MCATVTLERRISQSGRNSDTKNHGSSLAQNQKARTAISASVTSDDQVPKTAWALSEAAILQNAQNTNGLVCQEPADIEKRRSSLLTDIKDTPPLTTLIVSDDWRLQKKFTASGGTLQGDNSDVCLNVPEGAVDKGLEVMVRGAISTDTKGAHQLLKLSLEEVVVTPIVEYSTEPDYQFRKPVRIELPHFIPAGFDERDVRVYQYRANEAGELVVKQLEKQKPDILPDNDEDNNTMTLKSTTAKPMKNKNATPVNKNNAKRLKTETATSVKNKTAKTIKSKSAKTLKTDTKAMEAESMADSPVTTVAENVPTAKGRREITGKNRVFCVSAKGRRADIGRCSDSRSGTRPSSRRPPQWGRARPCAGPLRPTSAAQGPSLIENCEGSRPDYLSLPTGSVFSFDAKNKRVVVLTNHFSGYFCTYCRSEEFSNPSFGVEVYAREVERRDGGRKVDVLMKAWDGRRSIGDFREERPLEEMSGCRGMKLVDSKFLDALPENINVGPLFLCARLELQRPEDQRVWRHSLGLDGQPIFPEQETKDVNTFVPCGCLRAPWRVDWQLMSDPPLTPSHGFECLVHLKYQGFDNTQALPPNVHTKLTIQVHNVPTIKEDAASDGSATETARSYAPDLRQVPASSDRAEDRHLRPPIPDSGGQH